MEHFRRQPGWRRGFSLGEMIVVVIVGSLVLTAIATIYGRANRAAEAVLEKVQSPALAAEVLQLIAEDLRPVMGTEDVTLQIRNGFDNGFVRAEMVLRRTFRDGENEEQILEEITWRAAYDHGGQTPGLILYRSYEGVAPEDKLLDENRENWERNYPFVPICRGLTFFQIQAYKGEDLVEQWPPSAPPTGVKITLSFAEPYETVRGTADVEEELKVSRTIAIDPTRDIKFKLASVPDANEPGASKEQPSEDGGAAERMGDGRSGASTSGERRTDEPASRSRPIRRR